ncbi:MAG: 4-hydroxybenzoyl-CoA reductase subunit beta [Hyphomicrobiales bacterium]|nr:4-hydroxybenzoyl-CoA reductase subunit beta [Hyphomicrobiales bacterium]
MSEALPEFEFARPETIDEAIAARNGARDARYLAGGTDLVVNLRRGIVDADRLIDLTGIAELDRLDISADGAVIGASVKLAAVAENAEIRAHYPAVAEAAAVIAGPQHRSVGTVGGNLCLDTRCVYYNQSEWWRRANAYCLKYRGEICHVAPGGTRCWAAFSGDLAPAMLVHGAEIEIAGPDGRRRMPLGELYTDDGADHLTLDDGELVVAVHLPADDWRSAYDKIRVRDSIDFPLAGVAVAVKERAGSGPELRIALTGTDSRPVLVDGVAEAIAGGFDDATFPAAEKRLKKQVQPMSTTSLNAPYRRTAAAVVAKRLITRLAGRS